MLCIGYDWEKYGDSDNNAVNEKDIEDSIKGLKTIFRIHSAYGASFTLFSLGKVLEVPNQINAIRSLIDRSNLNSKVDIQIHGYSHTPFLELPNKPTFLSSSQVIEEIRKAKCLVNEIFKKNCTGLRPPYGHFQGLQRNPELVYTLSQEGINFISSDLRNENEQFPPPWNDNHGRVRNPYIYDFGSTKVLEIPTQGNADNLYRGVSKYIKTPALSTEEILNIHISNLQKAAYDCLVYTPLFHVWVVGRFDEDGRIIAGLIDEAVKRKIDVVNYIELMNLVRSLDK